MPRYRDPWPPPVVPDGPQVSPPMPDDLDEAECKHCGEVHNLNRPCPCPECDGDGKLPFWGGRDWQRKPCEACHGTGELGG